MALPFELPRVDPVLALVTPGHRELGRRAAEAVASSLSELLAAEVVIDGALLPAARQEPAVVEPLRFELAGLPGCAVLEVDPALAALLLDRLGGGREPLRPALDVTPLERAALELSALAAIQAVVALPEIEAALAPRLLRAAGPAPSDLAVRLRVRIGGTEGRCRLALPREALRRLGVATPVDPVDSPLPVALSFREGSAPLRPEELDALERGDVLLLDRRKDGRLTARLPGGARFLGRQAEEHFHVEEIQMTPEPSDYPIVVEVELARIPTTLGEVARLVPGALLPLPVDRSGFVSLLVGDRTIARGQLVEVEGAIGVRIEAVGGVVR